MRFVESENFQDYDLVMSELTEKLEKTKDLNEKKKIQKKIKESEEKIYYLYDFEGKCLIFLDAQSHSAWESWKTNLSHDAKYIKSFTTNKTKEGRVVGQKIVFKGYSAVIYCTAKDEISQDKTDEINQRFHTIFLKGSPKKYAAMLELEAKRNCLPGIIFEEEVISKREIEQTKEIAVRLSELVKHYGRREHPILNPYGDYISKQFKNDAGYRTRQESMLLNNITVLTLANADHRPKVLIDGEEYPIAIKSDILCANKLTKDSLHIAANKIRYFNENIKPAINANGYQMTIGESTIKCLSAREIAEWINENKKLSTDRQKLLESYLQPLADHGFLEEFVDPTNAKRHLFSVPKRFQEQDATSESTFIDESTMDDSCVKSFIERYLFRRLSKGNIEFVDQNGNKITIDQLLDIIIQIDDKPSQNTNKNTIIDSSIGVDESKKGDV